MGCGGSKATQDIVNPIPNENNEKGRFNIVSRTTDSRITIPDSRITIPLGSRPLASTPSTPELRLLAAYNPEARNKLAEILGQFERADENIKGLKTPGPKIPMEGIKSPAKTPAKSPGGKTTGGTPLPPPTPDNANPTATSPTNDASQRKSSMQSTKNEEANG